MTIGIIVNPNAGNHKAQHKLLRFRDKWQGHASFWDAVEPARAYVLARRAVREGYSIIAAAGGDGTVHHVANGMLDEDASPSTTIAVVPLGSANDYAFSLAKQFGVAKLDDDQGFLVDVGLATSLATKYQQYFLESLGLGLSGHVAAEAQLLRNLRGRWRYLLAAARVMRRGLPAQQLQLSWDGNAPASLRTSLLSLMLGQREGHMILAPKAILDDGQFDYVHAAELSIGTVLRILPRLAWLGPPSHHSKLTLGKCRTLSVESNEPLTAHTDGEVFCDPMSPTCRLDIRILPSRLRVKVCLP